MPILKIYSHARSIDQLILCLKYLSINPYLIAEQVRVDVGGLIELIEDQIFSHLFTQLLLSIMSCTIIELIFVFVQIEFELS